MILDFLREDYSEVIGAYYDDDKITLSRHINSETESAEVNFSIEDDVSEIEQIAEKFSSYVLNAAGKLPKWDFVCVKARR